MTTTFILTSTTAQVVGIASSIKAAGADQVAVKAADDLKIFSLTQLTDLYNSLAAKAVKKFSSSKEAAVAKVYAALEAKSAELTKLEVVKAVKAPKAPKVVKEKVARPLSKLQALAALLRETDAEGNAISYSVPELMAKLDMEDGRTRQYLSILKNPKDRFVMNIVKTEDKRFVLAAA